MPITVECFYDLSSPWTRLAFHNLTGLLAGTGATITWRPFLVGGVFNAVNPEVYQARQNTESSRAIHTGYWLKEWARLAGVAMNFPSPHHPLRSVSAMRFCCALQHDQAVLHTFSNAAFEAYFGEQRNLDDIDVLVDIANSCGLDGPALAQQANQDAARQALRDNTQEAIDRGAFGSPTMFVNNTYMYFGNDQLPLLEARVKALANKQA